MSRTVLQHRIVYLAGSILLVFGGLLLTARITAHWVTWGRSTVGAEVWTYTMSPQAVAQKGSEAALDTWLRDEVQRKLRGGHINDKNKEVGMVFNLNTSAAKHRLFRSLLTEEFGRENWQLAYEPAFVLRTGLYLSIFEHRQWYYPADPSAKARILVHQTRFDWPSFVPYKVLIHRGGFRLGTSDLAYDGRSWPLFLTLATGPVLLVYFLRRPLKRALRPLRRH